MDRTVAVNFTCNDGYILFGPATRNCTSLGSWTGITPSCISMFTSICMHVYRIYTVYRMEGNFGGYKLWRILSKITVGEIDFGEFERL